MRRPQRLKPENLGTSHSTNGTRALPDDEPIKIWTRSTQSTHIPAAIHIDRLPSHVSVLYQHHHHRSHFLDIPESPNWNQSRIRARVRPHHLRINQGGA